MSIQQRIPRRTRALASGFIMVGGLTGCYEPEVGPVLASPVPISNACLDLQAETADNPDALKNPEGLLKVFDCLNSGGAFTALRAPVAYLAETGQLDPYFIDGYLDPLKLDVYVQQGDITLTIQSLEALINDPDEPLAALMDVYVDVYEKGHVESLMHLGRDYSGYLYRYPDGCFAADDVPCPLNTLLDLANDLLALPELETLQAYSEEQAAMQDPLIQEAIKQDALVIADQITADRSPTGKNLPLALADAAMYDRLEVDPARPITQRYAGKTFFEAMQQPLCQLRSDKDLLDAVKATSASAEATGQTSYLPLYLRTLFNVNPSGTPRSELFDETDLDQDGFSQAEGDCNDGDSQIYPGSEATEDRVDTNCDLVIGSVPSDTDFDDDGVSPEQGDCNDLDPSVHPGLRVYESNGGITVVDPALEDTEDLKDNDCDGFSDFVPSSMDLVFKAAGELLPLLYEVTDQGVTTLAFGLETAATSGGATMDVEALLIDNQELIDSIIYNLNNGTLSPDQTALLRVNLPIAYVLADMGLLTASDTGPVEALWQDHVDYENGKALASGSEAAKYTQYANACGEEFEQYVDSVTILEELVRVMDAYRLINNEDLAAFLPIVVNSDLLLDASKMPSTPLGQMPEDVVDAALTLFDYFLRPPQDSGLYSDQYQKSRIWTLAPMLDVFFDDPNHSVAIDALMRYVLDDMNNPDSPLYKVPDALDALSAMDTGGTVDKEGLINTLLGPDARRILINGLAIPANPDFTYILLGDWDLVSSASQKYETDESTLEFSVRWIKEGVIETFLDMAGTLLEWLVENTGFGDPVEAAPAPTAVPEASPTPSPTPGP